MTDHLHPTAARLLDAQVAHLVAELTGPAATELVATELRHLLEAIRDVRVSALIDRDEARATVVSLLPAAAGSTALRELMSAFPSVIRDLSSNEDHRLADLVDRASVAAVVDELAGSEQLREEVLRRLGESPTLAQIAMRFVTALVGDAVQQNRERAERVPGVKSLFGVGDFAARQARGLAPKGLEQAIGGAADKGAQVATERVTRAMFDIVDGDAIRAVVMELWDLHADDPIASLRAYVAEDEVDDIAVGVHGVLAQVLATPWVAAVVGAGIEAFFDRYADVAVGELLDQLGIDDAMLDDLVGRHAPRLVDGLVSADVLAPVLRRRLAAFWSSPAANQILADG